MARTITPAPGTRRSLQRGTTLLSSPLTTMTVTVNAVNPAKAALRMLGCADASATKGSAYVELLNSTTIRVTRADGSGNTTISWELDESY